MKWHRDNPTTDVDPVSRAAALLIRARRWRRADMPELQARVRRLEMRASCGELVAFEFDSARLDLEFCSRAIGGAAEVARRMVREGAA